MNEQDFFNLSYQEQWFHLIDFIYNKYAHKPFLFYALKITTQLYEQHLPFKKSLLNILEYYFT